MQFVAEQGRNYGSTGEFGARYENWLRTDSFIKKHNADPTSTSETGHNHFSDLSFAEKSGNGHVEDPMHHTYPEHLVTNLAASSINWKGKCSTPVKNQKACQSCWAFGAVEVIETRACIKRGGLTNISVQAVLDCAPTGKGCQGGVAANAYGYLADNFATRDGDYP